MLLTWQSTQSACTCDRPLHMLLVIPTAHGAAHIHCSCCCSYPLLLILTAQNHCSRCSSYFFLTTVPSNLVFAGTSARGQLSHHVDFWVSSNGCGGQTPALAPLLQAAQLQECRLGQLVYVRSASDVGCATRHGAHGVMIGNGNLMSGMSSFAQTREIIVVSTLSSVPRELAKRYRPLASIPADAAHAEGSDPGVHQVEST